MKIALLILLVSVSVTLAARFPVSISTTNGRAFGTTDISSLVGKIITGNVTNELGSRVAFLSDTNGLGGSGGTSNDWVGSFTGDGTGLSNVTSSASATNVNDVFSYVLDSAASISDTSITLDRNFAGPNTTAGHVIIGFGQTNVEVRSVNGVSGAVISIFALANAHAAGDRVVWISGGDITFPDAKAVPSGSVNAGWEVLQLLEQGGNLNLWIDGSGKTVSTTIPLVAPNSTRVKSMQVNAIAGYPLDNTNVWMYMGRQGLRYSFTADAATDVITISGGWNPPGGGSVNATNLMVVFYDFDLGTLPQPLSNGIPYFVRTNSSTALTVKLRPYDSDQIDLTSSGSGVMNSEAGSLGKDFLSDVYFNGGVQPLLNGAWFCVQQQTYLNNVRADNFQGTAVRFTGQQADVNNLEIIGAGVGMDLRAGVAQALGMQFLYVKTLNIEDFQTAIILGGQNNVFTGVHLEDCHSSSNAIIDGTFEFSESTFDGVTIGSEPGTNTVFDMGSASLFAEYDLRNLYASAAIFNSPQLMLNDHYRGHRIYTYNGTTGPNRRIRRILAPTIPQISQSSEHGGENWLGQDGRLFTGPQQHPHEAFLILRAGTNDTGPLLEFRRSDFTTNSSFSQNGGLAMSTDYVESDFVPIAGKATFAMSNSVLYMVTSTKTNLISDGR